MEVGIGEGLWPLPANDKTFQ